MPRHCAQCCRQEANVEITARNIAEVERDDTTRHMGGLA